MGGIGLENHAETREFCKNGHPVTPKATLLEHSVDETLFIPAESEQPNNSFDLAAKNAIPFD